MVDRLIRGRLLTKKKEKIWIIDCGRVGQAFCNRSKSKLLLQKNERMIQWIVGKVVTCVVAKHIFRKYIFYSLNLKILGYAAIHRKKKDFELFWKFLAFEKISTPCWRIVRKK